MRLPLQVGLSVAAVACCGLLLEANAGATTSSSRSLVAGDDWRGARVGNGARLGNGRFNHNSFIINSPSRSHDFQHIRNVNVGGNTVTPAALCKSGVRRCKIIQHLEVFDP